MSEAAKTKPSDASAEVTYKIPIDDRRTLVPTMEDGRRGLPSWKDTFALGEKWMRFFRDLGIDQV
jgi:hypothetical protein